ncbi:hypothetical protein [Treponema sp.]|uniref:hypothetical protein n=1 Tax=Treponema sp. TaxID=166 RepID=UPI00298E5484|nr:hypothetical protein [Treponema sp.]MCQ2242123.1 hypothetical protein [Treponema sp.]
MDIENINSKANAGLTTGIIGTAGVGLGLLGSLLMGNNAWGMNAYAHNGFNGYGYNNNVCRQEYAGEMNMLQELARKDAEIQALKSDQKTDAKILDLYRYVEGKFHEQDRKFADQGIWNATTAGGIGSIGAQIHDMEREVYGLTKRVIPMNNVCPQPMPRYNSWTEPAAPTAEPTA